MFLFFFMFSTLVWQDTSFICSHFVKDTIIKDTLKQRVSTVIVKSRANVPPSYVIVDSSYIDVCVLSKGDTLKFNLTSQDLIFSFFAYKLRSGDKDLDLFLKGFKVDKKDINGLDKYGKLIYGKAPQKERPVDLGGQRLNKTIPPAIIPPKVMIQPTTRK